ncbi:hypothetical protein IMZ48_06065, partial [Candidatus Bathyarchaeota archaeon]|nr:hypothetical protein [Candidatus Bathyarchaeota archaeon]
LRENLDELQQTVNLLQSDNHDEFFDMSTRNKKYGRVDAMNGPILLEKYGIPRNTNSGAAGSNADFYVPPRLTSAAQSSNRTLANLSSRFGMK